MSLFDGIAEAAPTSRRAVTARRRTMPPALRVANWSGGFDSTVMVLMAEHGEIPPFDAIIFADTQQELDETYETLEWVLPLLTPPVYKVTTGDLGADILAVAEAHKNGATMSAGHSGQPPFWTKNAPNLDYATADNGGMLWRKCTHDYKIVPIRRKIRELLGVASVGRLPRNLWVDQAIAFPVDELSRTFCSDVQWITNTYPLIEKRIWKRDYPAWMRAHGYPEFVPKSACRFCPFADNARWRRMRDTQPHEWMKTIAWERALHAGKLPGLRGVPYLHKSMIPLEMAPIDDEDDTQISLCWACHT